MIQGLSQERHLGAGPRWDPIDPGRGMGHNVERVF